MQISRRCKLVLRGLVALMVILVALWIFENRRGAEEWALAQERASDKGVFLERSDYAGAEIPDEENILKDQVLQVALEDASAGGLGDWWDLFADASLRKSTRLAPITEIGMGVIRDYRDFFSDALSEEEAQTRLVNRSRKVDERLDTVADLIHAKPPHQIFAKGDAEGKLFEASAFPNGPQFLPLVKCMICSTRLSIRTGDSVRALKMIKVIDRLSRTTMSPERIDFLQSGLMSHLVITSLWEGLRFERWSVEQIEALEVLLSERDWRDDYRHSLEYQLAFQLELLNTFLKGDLRPQTYQDGRSHILSTWLAIGGPRGWDNRRRAFVTNFYLDLISDVESGAIPDPSQLENRFGESTLSPLYYRHYHLDTEWMMYRSFESLEMRKRLALIALALEKEKLSTGRYADELSHLNEDLELEDISDPKRPKLRYQLGPDGRPEIWSAREKNIPAQDRDHRYPRYRWQYWPQKVEKKVTRRPLLESNRQ